MKKAEKPDRMPGQWALPVAAAVNGVGTGMYVPFTLVFFRYVTGLSFKEALPLTSRRPEGTRS